MKINKRSALFFLEVISAFILFGAVKFFYFHETFFKDFNRKIPQLPLTNYWVLVMIPGILAIIIYIGLFWMVKTFKEKRWIRSGIIVFFFAKIFCMLSIPLTGLTHIHYIDLYEVEVLNRVILSLGFYYMLLTLLFVKHRYMRGYFWCFVLLMVFCEIAAYAGPFLYDEYGYNWLLISSDVLFYLAFIPIMVLFAKVYNLSRKEIVTPGKDDPSVTLVA